MGKVEDVVSEMTNDELKYYAELGKKIHDSYMLNPYSCTCGELNRLLSSSSRFAERPPNYTMSGPSPGP